MTADPASDDDSAYCFVVEHAAAGERIDAFLAAAIPNASRALIRRSIVQESCKVDGNVCKPSYRLRGGEHLELQLVRPPPRGPEPEPIPLDVLYQDEAMLVVNKPAGMVVHPAKGHWSGTLASAVAHRFGTLSTVGGESRPGIVHRLDRDTTGAIVIARTDAAHAALATQFHDRTVEKHYLAIVTGCPDRDRDRIEQPIGPHPSQREKMALGRNHPDARAAETFYEVLQRYRGFSLVRAEPKTGRTHQIRLHLLHAGHPVLCDRLYGGRASVTAGELRRITRSKALAAEFEDDAVLLDRQALHAHRLALDHPVTGERMEFLAPLAPDIARLKSLLQQTVKAT